MTETKPLSLVCSTGAQQSKSESECICNRPKGPLVCALCGYRMEGRIQKVCPQHKNRIYLTDLTICPMCRCAYLDECKR